MTRTRSETIQGAVVLAAAVVLFGIAAGAFRELGILTAAYTLAAIGVLVFGRGVRNAIAKNGTGR